MKLDMISSESRCNAYPRHKHTDIFKIRATLEKQGRPIGPYDVLIAATALSNNGVLVTHNMREFSRIEGLRIEDWH